MRNFEPKKSEESTFQTLFFAEKIQAEIEKSFESKKILSEKTFSTAKKCQRFDVVSYFWIGNLKWGNIRKVELLKFRLTCWNWLLRKRKDNFFCL